MDSLVHGSPKVSAQWWYPWNIKGLGTSTIIVQKYFVTNNEHENPGSILNKDFRQKWSINQRIHTVFLATRNNKSYFF